MSDRKTCKMCNRNPVMSSGYNKNGTKKWKTICSSCWERKNKGLEGPAKEQCYSLLAMYDKLNHCELCGFIAKHPSQLDIDHIDGNGLNHHHSNLQTICANCHRLKTHLQGDSRTPRVENEYSVPIPKSIIKTL